MAVSGRKTDVKSHLMKRRQLLHKTSSCKILSSVLSLSLSLSLYIYIYIYKLSPLHNAFQLTLNETLSTGLVHNSALLLEGFRILLSTYNSDSDHRKRNAWLSSQNIEFSRIWNTNTRSHTTTLHKKNKFLQSCRKLSHISQKLCDQRTWRKIKCPESFV
jgi:hypothetical protein